MKKTHFFTKHLVLLILGTLFLGTLKAQDLNKAKVYEVKPDVLYIGYGPTAHATNRSILGLYANERADSEPYTFTFLDAERNEMGFLITEARTNTVTGDVRVVIYDKATNLVLGNMAYASTGRKDEFVLDVGLERPEIIDVNGMRDEVLKMMSFNHLMGANQGYSNLVIPTCRECMPHDMYCSIPFYDNQPTYLKIYLGCEFIEVEVTDCCVAHDIDLYCASSISAQFTADVVFFDCLMETMLDEMSGENPWWCGGNVTAYLVGTPQAYAYATTFYYAVTAGTFMAIADGGFTDTRGIGYLNGSCLCPGGDRLTEICDEGIILCEGEPDPILCATLGVGVKAGWGCGPDDKGQIKLNAFGGCFPYTYSWSHDPALTDDQADNLEPGTYTVTVTDATGCVSIKTIEIEIPVAKLNVFGSVTYDCASPNNTGQINIQAVGGNDNDYDYSWSHDPSITTPDLENLTPGSYTVTVEDNLGCEVEKTFEFGGKLEVDMDISCWMHVTEAGLFQQAKVCATGQNGLPISISTSDGLVEGYDYVWSNGATEELVEQACMNYNFGTGYRFVDVIDGMGCSTRVYFPVDNSDFEICPEEGGVDDFSLLVSPNPNSGSFLVDVDVKNSKGSNVEIAVYNLFDSRMYYADLGFLPQGKISHRIDLGTVTPGMYVVTVNNGAAHEYFTVR